VNLINVRKININIYTLTMSGIETQIFNKYLEIKQDLVFNIKDVWNRKNYYTKKYRGNMLTNINVAVEYTTDGNKKLQIFVEHDKRWVRDVLIFNSKGIVSSNVKMNLGNNE